MESIHLKHCVQYYNMNTSNSLCIIVKGIEPEIMKSMYFKNGFNYVSCHFT